MAALDVVERAKSNTREPAPVGLPAGSQIPEVAVKTFDLIGNEYTMQIADNTFDLVGCKFIRGGAQGSVEKAVA